MFYAVVLRMGGMSMFNFYGDTGGLHINRLLIYPFGVYQSEAKMLRVHMELVEKWRPFFYTLLFRSLFKVEFDINHFVLGGHQEC